VMAPATIEESLGRTKTKVGGATKMKNSAARKLKQDCALTDNKCYREGGGCVKISVTKEVKGDTTQYSGICTGTQAEVSESIERREG